MGTRATGIVLLAVAVLGALAVVALARVHGGAEPVLGGLAVVGLVGAVLVVLSDRRRARG